MKSTQKSDVESDIAFRLLLETFNPGTPNDAELLKSWWFDQQILIESSTIDFSRRAVSVTSNFSQIGCFSVGPPGIYIPSTMAFLDKFDATPQERERLVRAGKSIEPSALGTWLTVTNNGIAGGWLFLDEISVNQVAICLSDSPQKEIFIQWVKDLEAEYPEWSEEYERGVISAIQHSISLKPSTAVHLPLAYEEGEYILEPLRQLYEQLDLEWLHKNLLGLIFQEPVEPLELVIEFNEDGIISAGLSVYKPKMEKVLALSSLSKDFSDEQLAQWEGILQTKGPDAFLLSKSGGRWNMKLDYIIRGSSNLM